VNGVRLAEISSRFIGGRRVKVSGQQAGAVSLSGSLRSYHHDPNDAYHIEHAYVQQFVPADAVQSTPVLLVHGGGMTGACWESTPDGRPGWLWALLRAGLPVSVLDNVERGRAGWCSLPDTWDGAPIMRGERDMWVTFRIGAEDGYADGKPFPGSQFPVWAIEEMLRQSVPRWPGNAELAIASMESVVDELGPVVLIGHSQGGGLCAQVAARRPDAVRAVVLVEPHGLPETSPPGGYPPQVTIIGDNIERSALWIDLVARMRAHTDTVRRGGGTAETWDLPALGIAGNSHNPMMDINSDDIADRIVAWLAALRTGGQLS
jgi:pimeloyl-ACP methyl ester carboxylesterase